MALETETIHRIKALLKIHPKGLTITEITSRLKMNRNSVSKYLEVLLISGHVETHAYGPSRVFFLAHRLPISSLVSLSSNLLVTLDANNEILFTNDSFNKFFSLDQEEIIGCHIVELCRKGIGSDNLPDLLSDVLARQEEDHDVQLKRNGEIFYFKVKSIKMVFDDGSHGLTILFDDVTREKKDRLELEVKEARYRGIVDDQTEFIIRFLPDGTLTFVNKFCSQYYGKALEDLKDVRYIPGISDDDCRTLLHRMQSLSRFSPVMEFECRVYLFQEQVRWNHWTIRALFDGEEKPVEYQAVGRDITEIKAASEKIAQYVSQMEFLSRKLQGFLELSPSAEIYHTIGAGLCELLPGAVIAVNSYDTRISAVTIRAVFNDEDREIISRRIGRELIGLEIPVGKDAPPEGFLSGKVYYTPRNLYNIFFQQVPEDICAGIERDLNLGKFYSVGLIWQGILVGNITFALRKGQELENRPLIDMYVRTASIVLQRYSTDEALRESEAKYRALIEKAREAILIAQDGCFVFVNPRMADLLGKPAAELIDRPFLDYLWPDDRDMVVSRYKKRLNGEDVPDSYDFRIIGGEGGPIWVSISATRILWKGRPATLNLLTNITDRKHTEEALRESESLYRTVVENVQDVFYRSDCNGNLILASQSWAKILGYPSLDECIGENIAEKFYFEPEKRKEFLADVYAKGSVSDYVVVLKKKDGTPLFVSTNSHIYHDRNGIVAGVEGVFRDISEARASAEKVRRYITQIEFLSERLISFIEMDPSENIFQKIAFDLQSLVPGSLIVANSFHPGSGVLTIEGISMPGPAKHILNDILGEGVIGSSFIVDDAGSAAFQSGKIRRVNLALFDITFKTIPEPVYKRLESELGIGDVYAIGFVRKEKILGNATIFLLPGSTIPDLKLIEMYIQEASIVLQRHIAENEIRRQDEIFYNLTQNSPLPIALIEPDGTWSYVNQSFIRLFGYSLDDFHTCREWAVLAFPDPAYRRKVIDAWRLDLRDSQDGKSCTRTFSIHCKDLTIKEVISRLGKLSDNRKCLLFEDITERRVSEQNRKLLSAIVTSTSDAVIGKDITGTILSWNPAAKNLYGYTAEEIVGCNIRQVIPSEKQQEMEEIMARIRKGESVSSLETRRIRKDGRVIDVAVTISPITDEAGIVTGASTIARDITRNNGGEGFGESRFVRPVDPDAGPATLQYPGENRLDGS